MEKLILVPDHFYNCPICGSPCDVTDPSSGFFYMNLPYVKNPCHVFYCYNPLVTDPLHYYSYIVEKDKPDIIAYQEFSLDLGAKSILFAINYLQQKSIVKNARDVQPLELDFVIAPDFPKLEHLKRKIKTAIVFS